MRDQTSSLLDEFCTHRPLQFDLQVHETLCECGFAMIQLEQEAWRGYWSQFVLKTHSKNR